MAGSILDRLSDSEFERIVLDSLSLTEVTKRCGFHTYKSGSNRERVKKRIKNSGICTNHFKKTGRQYEKPSYNKIINYEDVLKNGSDVNRITVKNIILREKLVPYVCSECGNSGIWNGKELCLQLHHKDGDSMNNSIENLTFLCPNCHSQTENYSYRNAKRPARKKYYCSICGKEITRNSRTGRCRDCAAKDHIIEKPPKEELISVIKDVKFKKYVCFHYGISEKTWDVWLKSYGLPTHIAELHRYLEANQL